MEQPLDKNSQNEHKELPIEPLQNHSANTASEMQESILDDVADFTGYDKNLKNARYWLYAIAALQVVMGIYEYSTYDTYATQVRWLVFGIDAGIGLLFLACALWSYKKPYAAFVSALVLYVIVSIGAIILNPAGIGLGIVIKIVVVVALIRAVKDAREMEDAKNSLGA